MYKYCMIVYVYTVQYYILYYTVRHSKIQNSVQWKTPEIQKDFATRNMQIQTKFCHTLQYSIQYNIVLYREIWINSYL